MRLELEKKLTCSELVLGFLPAVHRDDEEHTEGEENGVSDEGPPP